MAEQPPLTREQSALSSINEPPRQCIIGLSLSGVMEEVVEVLERIAMSLENIEMTMSNIQDEIVSMQSQSEITTGHLEELVGEMNWISPSSAMYQIKSELESISDR